MNEKFPQHNSAEQQPNDYEQPATEQALSAEAETETGHERQGKPNPLIYVASLADYEQGRQHGVWLYAANEAEAIYNDIHRMLAHSEVPGADRFAIRDSEGFGAFTVHETDGIELVTKVARGIRRHGLAYAVWAEVNEDAPELLDHFNKAYKGHFESLATYAEHLMEQMGHEADRKSVV